MIYETDDKQTFFAVEITLFTTCVIISFSMTFDDLNGIHVHINHWDL